MPVSLLRLPLVGAALLVALAAVAADPPPPPDPADDPLPPGAKARFSVTRYILRTNPSVGLVPPTYTTFLAPTVLGGIRPYDVGTHRPLIRGGPLVGPGNVAVSGDGKRAAVIRPGALTVVEVDTRKQLLAVHPPEGVLIVGNLGASLSGDGTRLAYGGQARDGKGVVVVWDVDKDEQVARIDTMHRAPVFPLLSGDGKTLVSHGPPPPPIRIRLDVPGAEPPPPPPVPADVARLAQVWDLATGRELVKARVTGMGGMCVSSAITADGSLLAISSADGPVDLWDVKAGKRLHTLLGRKAQGLKVAISPDGKTVASVGPDKRIQRWSSDGTPLDVTEAPPGILISPVSGLVFADNQRAIAWTTAAQFAVAWEAPTGRLVTPLMDHVAGVRSIAFPPDGKDLFTSGNDGNAFRWDLATGALNEPVHFRPAHIPGEPRINPHVHLSADGSRATGSKVPPATEVFEVATGGDLFTVPAPSVPPARVRVTLSPDGLKVITACRGAEAHHPGACVIWDLMTQKRVAEFELPVTAGAEAPAVAMSPDGTRVAVLTLVRKPNNPGPVVVITGYDVRTGRKLAEVEDPTASGSVTLTLADATTAVMTSTAGRVWSVDYASGKVGETIDKLPGRTTGEAAPTGPVAVSPDGTRFAVGVAGEEPETYAVRVYDWPRGKLLHTFTGHRGPVSTMRFTPDSKFLATGAQDTSVLLWDLSKIPMEK